MAAKSSISLVAVQKPTANTPILQRRNQLTANIGQQINKIGSFRDGKRISRKQFWVDASGAIYFQLRYGKQPLELKKGKSTLKASTFEDPVAQLDETSAASMMLYPGVPMPSDRLQGCKRQKGWQVGLLYGLPRFCAIIISSKTGHRQCLMLIGEIRYGATPVFRYLMFLPRRDD